MRINILIPCLLHFLLVTGTYQAHAVDYKYPANNKVLFYAPGFSTPGDAQDAITRDGQDFFDKSVYFNDDPTPLKDQAASVEAVKSFGDYGTIILHTHGWYWKYPWEYEQEESNLNYSCFRTGSLVQFPIEPTSSYANELANHRLVVSKSPNTQGDYHYVVTPAYIKKHLTANALDGAFFFLGICASFKDNQFLHSGMWDALESKGAKVGFGYSDYVSRVHNVDMFTQLMNADGMLPADSNIPPKTAGQAYTNISGTTDPEYHLRAEFEKEVASDEWNNFVFAVPNVLRIRVTLRQKKDYYVFWNLDTEEEFTIYDSQSGAELTQPISTATLSSTSANNLKWQPDSGTPYLTIDRSNRFTSLVFDAPETEKPPFSFTAKQTSAEDLVRSRKTVMDSYNRRTSEDINVYNWQGATFLGSTAILGATVNNLRDLSMLYPQGVGRLHFKNSPAIITYSNINQHYELIKEGQFDCSVGYSPELIESRTTLSGESNILGEIFQSTYSFVGWQPGDVMLASSLNYNGPYDLFLSKHGFIDTDTAKVDILLVPLFSNNESGPDICAQHNCFWNQGGCQPDGKIWSPEHPTPSTLIPYYTYDIIQFGGAEEIFTGFKIASGFSLKKNVMRSGAATESTWDDYSYATYSPKLSAWLTKVINANFTVASYLEIPEIFCSMNQ